MAPDFSLAAVFYVITLQHVRRIVSRHLYNLLEYFESRKIHPVMRNAVCEPEIGPADMAKSGDEDIEELEIKLQNFFCRFPDASQYRI